ncbi:MAG: FixH family protein, partial [Chloroflexota bacterium]|nr:FixH family protein [Chloroflexota bacterium]
MMPRIHQRLTSGARLLLLGVVGVVCAACSSGASAPTSTTGAPPAFHATLKTSDGMFLLQFSVTPDRLGLNTFTVRVDAASSDTPVPSLQVQLMTTMLDMDMGTSQLDLSLHGPRQYSAQGALPMSGHWKIRI